MDVRLRTLAFGTSVTMHIAVTEGGVARTRTGCMCATAVLPRVTSVYGTMSSLSVAVRSLYPKNSGEVSTARALAAPRGVALGQAFETTVHLVPPGDELSSLDKRHRCSQICCQFLQQWTV